MHAVGVPHRPVLNPPAQERLGGLRSAQSSLSKNTGRSNALVALLSPANRGTKGSRDVRAAHPHQRYQPRDGIASSPRQWRGLDYRVGLTEHAASIPMTPTLRFRRDKRQALSETTTNETRCCCYDSMHCCRCDTRNADCPDCCCSRTRRAKRQHPSFPRLPKSIHPVLPKQSLDISMSGKL